MAEPLDRRGLVRNFRTRLGRPGQSLAQQAQAKHLRGIGQPDRAAVDRLLDATVGRDALERVLRRNGQQPADRILAELVE